MDVSHLLDSLNTAQREAVSAAPGHYLVLAGAGSGKTRVLTHRIGWLAEVEQVPPWAILAVTFTNKAAGEMRGRLESLLTGGTRGLSVGTFHGIAHRLLRRHWREANLPEGFQILDADDQQRLVKRVVAGLGLDEARYPPRQAAWQINAWKDEGKRPDAIEPGAEPPSMAQSSVVARAFLSIYRAYEDACRRAGLVDFAELLLRAHELWLHDPAVLAHYRERWRYLLIDEFQDTNTLQYAWIRVLAGSTGTVFAVGDDDQSIYGWRGAKVENMRDFLRDFPGAKTIRLEQNYRSTANILEAANAVIARNPSRLGKQLWTSGDKGVKIALYAAYNEQDEARFVIERVREHLDGNGNASDIAVLYRSNAQSRAFEEQLIQRDIAYRVYGGQRYFERAEVKDALSYLRLAANRHDDAAFERAVNTPPRGIGERTLDQLRRRGRADDTSLWDAALAELASAALAARAKNAMSGFMALLDGMARAFADITLAEQIEHAIAHSGLRDYYERDSRGNAESRVENLDELVNVASRFEPTPEDVEAGLSELAAFLAHAALEAGEAQGDAGADCVQLMT
ncbi:MAG: UvrD-helicase domain-containing protein, partial [Rhodanobacteraceae bacterium]